METGRETETGIGFLLLIYNPYSRNSQSWTCWKLPSGSPTWEGEEQALEPHSNAAIDTSARSWIGNRASRTQSGSPLWDAGVVNGSLMH